MGTKTFPPPSKRGNKGKEKQIKVTLTPEKENMALEWQREVILIR